MRFVKQQLSLWQGLGIRDGIKTGSPMDQNKKST
jgi:hypothetical protein